jgi:hypothetical protein
MQADPFSQQSKSNQKYPEETIMKSNKFVAAAVVALAGLASTGAFAQNAQYGEAALVVAADASTSNVSRAQVNAAYLQARQNGAVAVSQEAVFANAPASANLLTRAAVREEARHYVMLDGSNRKIYR